LSKQFDAIRMLTSSPLEEIKCNAHRFKRLVSPSLRVICPYKHKYSEVDARAGCVAAKRLFSADEEGATTTRAFQVLSAYKRHPNSRKLRAQTCTSTHSNIDTSSCITSRSPSGSMEIENAPEHMTKGLDARYLKRVEWAYKMYNSRAKVFRGLERPGDPSNAARTLEDLI
jgi:hypothetical protein